MLGFYTWPSCTSWKSTHEHNRTIFPDEIRGLFSSYIQFFSLTTVTNLIFHQIILFFDYKKHAHSDNRASCDINSKFSIQIESLSDWEWNSIGRTNLIAFMSIGMTLNDFLRGTIYLMVAILIRLTMKSSHNVVGWAHFINTS